jgi:solute carrier family 25 citrate transporter 1
LATMTSTVTPLEHTAIGGLGGAVEMVLMQPMLACKNALQEGRPIPRNPLHLYRGLGVRKTMLADSPHFHPFSPIYHPFSPVPTQVGVMAMAPITASQFGTNRVVQQFLAGSEGAKLTGLQTFASAAIAGGVSAFIASPTELIVIQQQVG